ncbi:shikimate dehydrogenase [Bradyrhizobium diazoefficiens]|nr:shikimate dehydrogenase [Bradyrhizobium diazoefficiens]UCF53371.1 MAG: shikimate dehydrogenase [Bradyrhizobium sp.]MBR0968212.1 shikimate dehydrogenase [Bradyrhizobium diazoefficiens]MBR0981609.1 shikimate dehydrogenase [Bradyrhizobium diazoefficiens]MBR1011062.1 shikimate dehydrogenase [Bradyrhizobium diazoefficiens]MBR1017562.1 shikimate dehydrogenase [Bradyrhizobium diazoefficiens]
MSKRGYAASKKLLTGLIGAPIAHSASPAMHERAAEMLGLRCHYQLIEVAGADAAGLAMMLEGVRRLGFAGVNVTFPYKEAVVPLLDALAPGAAAMGAVNTVVARDGRLTGHNTDTTGFARAVAPLLAPSGNAVAVIGAGGVGKAIAFALANLDVADIRIFDSEPARAGTLVSLLAPRCGARVAASVEDALHGATGLVNGTPVGMLPNRDMPVAATLLHDKLWVADAVYSPLITPLLAAAQERGARIMTGRELAIYQAAEAFELFTGLAPSTDVMGEAFDAVMAARSSAYVTG